MAVSQEKYATRYRNGPPRKPNIKTESRPTRAVLLVLLAASSANYKKTCSIDIESIMNYCEKYHNLKISNSSVRKCISFLEYYRYIKVERKYAGGGPNNLTGVKNKYFLLDKSYDFFRDNFATLNKMLPFITKTMEMEVDDE